MPYITIKTLEKEESVKKATAMKVAEVFGEMWGCGKEHVSVSIIEDDLEAIKAEVAANLDSVYVRRGELVK